jgi:hypothetical protein
MDHLSALPFEILDQITSELDLISNLHLSSCSKGFRAFLVPHLFSTITFSNVPRVADSALLAAKSYGHLVRTLYFAGITDETNDDILPDAIDDLLLPDSALKLLAADHILLPNLECLRVAFNFDWDYLEFEFANKLGAFEKFESDEDVLDAERSRKHRQLIVSVWKAISLNSVVKKLVVDDLPAETVSYWSDPAWHHFLAGIEELEVSILAVNKWASFAANTVGAYVRWVPRVRSFFFDHCRALRHLKLVGGCRLGLDWWRYVPMPLRTSKDFLPSLQSLELVNIYLCDEVSGFLESHNDTLQKLVFKDVAGAIGSTDFEKDQLWCAFFDRIRPKMKALRSFSLARTDVALCFEEKDPTDHYYKAYVFPEKAEEMRKAMAENPQRLVFTYCAMEEELGTCLYDYETQMESIALGLDQEAYDKFVAQVEENKRAAIRLSHADLGQNPFVDHC